MTERERLEALDVVLADLGRLREDISAGMGPEWSIVATAAELDRLCQLDHQRIRIVQPLTINQKIVVHGKDIIIKGLEGAVITGTGGRTPDGKAPTMFHLDPKVDGFTLSNLTLNCEQKTTVVRIQGNGVRGSGAKNVKLEKNTVARCGSMVVSEAGGVDGLLMEGNRFPATGYVGSRMAWLEGKNITLRNEQYEGQCPNEQVVRATGCEGLTIGDCYLKDDTNKQTLAVQFCLGASIKNTTVVGGRLEVGPLSSVDAVVGGVAGGAWKEATAAAKDIVLENVTYPWCDLVSTCENVRFVNCVGPKPSLKVGSGNGVPKRYFKNVVWNGETLAP